MAVPAGLTFAEGWESQPDSHSVAAGNPVLNFLNNPGQLSYVAGLDGGRALRITGGGGYARTDWVAAQVQVGGAYFRGPSGVPADNDSRILTVQDGTGARVLDLSFLTSNGIRATLIGNTHEDAAGVIDNAWHLLEWRLNTSGTTWTFEWQIDRDPKTTVTEAGHVATSGTTMPTQFLWGTGVLAHNAVCDWDHILGSQTSADYPLHQFLVSQAWRLRFKGPNADGTHNTGTNNVIGEGGETTNLYQHVDDWNTDTPANNAEYLHYTNEGTSTPPGDAALRYAELAIQNLTGDEEAIWDVWGLCAAFSVAAGPNVMIARVTDSVNNTLGDITGDISETSIRYHKLLLTPPAPGWLAALDGLKFRVGFSSDVNPAPRIVDVGLTVITLVHAIVNVVGSGAVAGAGAISATAKRVKLGAAAVAGAGAIAGTGRVVKLAVANVSGAGAWSATVATTAVPGATLKLFKRVAGVDTELDTVTLGDVPDPGVVMKLEVIGNTLTGYLDDVSTIDTTDSSIATGFKVGVGLTVGQVGQLDDATIDSLEAASLDISGETNIRAITFPAAEIDTLLSGVVHTRTTTFPVAELEVDAIPIGGVTSTRTTLFLQAEVGTTITGVALSRTTTLPAGRTDSAIVGITLTRTMSYPSPTGISGGIVASGSVGVVGGSVWSADAEAATTQLGSVGRQALLHGSNVRPTPASW